MKKKILLIIGLILIIVPFLVNTYSGFRLISVLLGMVLVVLWFYKRNKNNIFFTILLFIILIIGTYDLDMFLYYKFTRIPLYVIETISSDKVSVYNSIFYRIYNCDSELTFDYGYDLSYSCSSESLSSLNINDILKDPEDLYSTYKGKFIKVEGKISKITGNDSLTLSLYELSDDTLNGYVNFNLNYNIKVNTNESLNNYRVYDNIVVIGLVKSIDALDGVYTITLDDTLLIPDSVYDDYEISIVSGNEGLTNLVKENDYYFYDIDEFNIIYDEENIYELSYLLLDSRLTWDDLIVIKTYKTIKNEDDEELVKIYSEEEYTLLDCANGKKIVANRKTEVDETICDLELSSQK